MLMTIILTLHITTREPYGWIRPRGRSAIRWKRIRLEEHHLAKDRARHSVPGWAKAYACCFNIRLSCSYLCQMVLFEYVSNSTQSSRRSSSKNFSFVGFPGGDTRCSTFVFYLSHMFVLLSGYVMSTYSFPSLFVRLLVCSLRGR